MPQNGQIHFKKSCSICCKIFKVCLTILEHYALKGEHWLLIDLQIYKYWRRFLFLNPFMYNVENLSIIRQKYESLNGVTRKQSTPHFPKNEHFLPSNTHKCVCVLGGKKCWFFGKFDVLCFLVTPVLRYSLLPDCGRIDHTYIESFVEAGSQDFYSTLGHFSTSFTKRWQVWQRLREYLLVHFDGCRICD